MSHQQKLLKRDLFGAVYLSQDNHNAYITRDLSQVHWLMKPLATYLAQREARVLKFLTNTPHVPQYIEHCALRYKRSWIEGQTMQHAKPTSADYFKQAANLLRALHRLKVTHNDTAKEPNWLVTKTLQPALIDFQLARIHKKRNRWFRTLAYEDIRHLLKHKRSYRPDLLTAREQRILNQPQWTSRLWRNSGKPVYLFITRRCLKWADREGATDRGSQT